MRHKDSRTCVRCGRGVHVQQKLFPFIISPNASKCITKRSPLRYATILNHRISGFRTGGGGGRGEAMEKLNRNKHLEFTLLRTMVAQQKADRNY